MDVPGVVAAKARLFSADQWLADLDHLVADVATAWDLRIGSTLTGGTEALVLAVTEADGRPAVLKLPIPRLEGSSHEGPVLRAVGGRGCVRLLRDRDGGSALLLERLGPSLASRNVSPGETRRLLADLAARLWAQRAPAGPPSGHDKATGLHQHLIDGWMLLQQSPPCARGTRDWAISCLARRARAAATATAVLCHGDIQPANALAHNEEYTLIDPEGIECEPAYDLGVIVRSDPDLVAGASLQALATELAEYAGVAPDAVYDWAGAEIVSTGFLLAEIGEDHLARRMLAVADREAQLAGPSQPQRGMGRSSATGGSSGAEIP